MVNNFKRMGQRIVLISLLISCLFFLTGCPDGDENFSLAEERYLIGWVLHNVNDSTDNVLDYEYDDLAIYNYTHNYPAYEAQTHSQVLFWLKPLHNLLSGGAGTGWKNMNVPLNTTYYLKGDIVDSSEYRTDWSFSNSMKINYIKGNDSNGEQFAYEAAHSEQYNSESAFYGIKPIPGESEEIYFGTAPFTPTSISVEDGFIRLNGNLMKGHNGNSYLLRNTVSGISSSNYGDINVYLEKPNYNIYKEGVLINSGNFTRYTSQSWDYTRLNHFISSSGSYTVNVSVPSGYPVWNKTLISAKFNYPNADIQPPVFNHMEFSPKFEINEEINFSVNISDENGINFIKIFYNTDLNSTWNELTVIENGVYESSLLIDNNSVQKINLKILAGDNGGNTVSYEIRPISLRTRTIQLNAEPGVFEIVKGETVEISGRCVDNLGFNCSRLKLKYYLNGEYANFDQTELFDYWREIEAGEFSGEIFIPYNFSSENADIKVVFEGTGVYDYYEEDITFGVRTYDHDVAVTDLIIPDIKRNERAEINATLYNVGGNDEASISVNLLINGDIVDNVVVTDLNVSKSEKISLAWTPTSADRYNVTVKADIVPGETYIANNAKSGEVLIGADIEVEMELANYYALIDEEVEIRVNYENLGDEDASNLTATLYTIQDESSFIFLEMGETTERYFNGTPYYISANYLGDSVASVTISYGPNVETFELFWGKVVKLKNGVYLSCKHVNQNYFYAELANGVEFSKDLEDIEKEDIKTDYINWSSSELGRFDLIMFVNTSEDRDWKSNYDRVNIEVKEEGLDVGVYLGGPSIVKQGDQKDYEITVFNEGTEDATNLKATIYTIQNYVREYIYHSDDETIIDFNGVIYNISSAYLDEKLLINISHEGVIDKFELLRNELAELQNGVYLEADLIEEGYARIYLSQIDEEIEIDLVDLPKYSSQDYEINLSFDNLGEYRLILIIEAPGDIDLTNNYDDRFIEVKPDAPDLRMWLNFETFNFPVNETAEMGISLNNRGFGTAENVSVDIYGIYDPDFECVNSLNLVKRDYNGTTYDIIGEVINDSFVKINVSYDSEKEEHILSEYQFVKLKSGLILSLEHGWDDVYCFILGEATHEISKDIGNLTQFGHYEETINWTPSQVGDLTWKTFVNTTLDANWQNNYNSDHSTIKINAPDLSGWLYLRSALILNQEAQIESRVYNNGMKIAENASATLYYKYYNESEYTLIGSSDVGNVSPLKRETAIFNWTPVKEGDIEFKLVVNSSFDADLTNNVDYRYSRTGEDVDNDGIVDEEDMLIGFADDIESNENLTVYVGGSSNLYQRYYGLNYVKIMSEQGSVASFMFDFYPYKIILPNVKIETDMMNNSYGYTLISGLGLSKNGEGKSVYVNKILGSDKLCVKDSEVAFISEISSKCNLADETIINCPSDRCTYHQDQYKISGLTHSGVREMPKSSSSGGKSGSGGGSGGGGSSSSSSLNKYFLDSLLTVSLTKQDVVEFLTDRGMHTIKLYAITQNMATLLINSEPIFVQVGVGQPLVIDVDNDDVLDLKIDLHSISNLNPTITFEKISESVVVPLVVPETVEPEVVKEPTVERPVEVEKAKERLSLTALAIPLILVAGLLLFVSKKARIKPHNKAHKKAKKIEKQIRKTHKKIAKSERIIEKYKK